MSRYILALCFGSAVAGGLVALAVREAAWLAPLPAQNTTFVDPNAARFSGTLPGAREPAEAELTAEERVNIAVYENVNRSVVNINTKGVRGESFFLIEIPSEGAGSG